MVVTLGEPLSKKRRGGGTALVGVPFAHSDLVAYIEALKVTQGRNVGQPFRLHPWQRRFLRGAFSQPDDAALSVARGAGKTTFMAAICCAALDGPLAAPNASTILIAASFEQAMIGFRHILAFMGPSLEANPRRYRIQDSVNRASVTDRTTGASVRVLGSDPARLHGQAPRLLLFDEVSQWPPGRIEAMISALRTSRGKIEDSRALWIGTRPASADHPFERALQGGVGYSQVHAARSTDPPFQRKTWRRANPGLDSQPDLLAVLKREAEHARRDPSQLAAFKALRLNMGVADTDVAVVLAAEVWRGLEVEEPPPLVGPYVLGVDLGQNQAQSAAAAYWPDSGYLDAFAVFPEYPDLSARGTADGVSSLYVRMRDRRELLQAGARVSDIASLLTTALERWGRPSAIVCDSWRQAELIGHLEAVGFPTDTALVTRRQGWQDGGADVRLFRRACLDGKVKAARSLLLRSALAEARTTSDASGNSKLAKHIEGRRKGARDDSLAASILAIAEGQRRASTPVAGPDYAVVG